MITQCILFIAALSCKRISSASFLYMSWMWFITCSCGIQGKWSAAWPSCKGTGNIIWKKEVVWAIRASRTEPELQLQKLLVRSRSHRCRKVMATIEETAVHNKHHKHQQTSTNINKPHTRWKTSWAQIDFSPHLDKAFHVFFIQFGPLTRLRGAVEVVLKASQRNFNQRNKKKTSASTVLCLATHIEPPFI